MACVLLQIVFQIALSGDLQTLLCFRQLSPAILKTRWIALPFVDPKAQFFTLHINSVFAPGSLRIIPRISSPCSQPFDCKKETVSTRTNN